MNTVGRYGQLTRLAAQCGTLKILEVVYLRNRIAALLTQSALLSLKLHQEEAILQLHTFVNLNPLID